MPNIRALSDVDEEEEEDEQSQEDTSSQHEYAPDNGNDIEEVCAENMALKDKIDLLQACLEKLAQEVQQLKGAGTSQDFSKARK